MGRRERGAAAPIESPPWHALPVDDVARRLGGDPERGLSLDEVRRRQGVHGPNRLAEVGRPSWYGVLARQFADALVLILAVAAAVSVLVGDVVDALTILAIVVLNAILGFVQEWRAERALEALGRLLAPRCRVVRDGAEQEIDATEVVPGDLVLLDAGDRVPADLRLVRAVDLRIDEASLTGESVPATKAIEPVAEDAPLAERRSIAWMGTAVTNGRAAGLVVATGMATEFGRIARLTESVRDETTPLQRKLGRLGRQLGALSIAVAAATAVAGWLAGRSPVEMLLTGIALAVAAVPEGLPAVVTVTLALGIRAMARRRALLRRLQAAEALGAATVICTDKTGTLTRNEMTVQRLWLAAGAVEATGVGYDPAGHFEAEGRRIDPKARPDLLAALETGRRSNHARIERTEGGWRAFGDPTEVALVVAAYKAWLPPSPRLHVVAELSFNAARKRMTVVERGLDGLVAHVKGAPEVLLPRASRILVGEDERPMTDEDRRRAEEAYRAMADRGLRTLALARRVLPPEARIDEEDVESDLTLLGLVGILDPPRPEVPGAVATARGAGIRVLVITGDAVGTAMAVARQIGLPVERALTETDLAGLDDGALEEALRGDVLFARTTPENKLRIVSVLQGMGESVAMTGDGVNDAPALKKADVGIAMGRRGTEVARAAADMILTDDNFASIVGAVEEGRRQYDNIQKFVRYLLSSNVAEIAAIFANVVLGGPLILLPVQILWMNLVTDSMTAVALGLERAEADVMRRPPRRPDEPILDGAGIRLVAALGASMAGATLWIFHDALGRAGPEGLAAAQTAAFTGLVLLEKINVFNFRALRAPLATIGFVSNPWILLAWVGAVGLQLAAVYLPPLGRALHTVPLGVADWLRLLAVAVPVFAVTETVKWLRWRRREGSARLGEREQTAGQSFREDPRR